MSLLYVPVVDHTGQVAGYAPLWFLGIYPIGVIGAIGSALSLVISEIHFEYTGVTYDMWWYPYAVTTLLASFVVIAWVWRVNEALFSSIKKPVWPTIRTLGDSF